LDGPPCSAWGCVRLLFFLDWRDFFRRGAAGEPRRTPSAGSSGPAEGGIVPRSSVLGPRSSREDSRDSREDSGDSSEAARSCWSRRWSARTTIVASSEPSAGALSASELDT